MWRPALFTIVTAVFIGLWDFSMWMLFGTHATISGWLHWLASYCPLFAEMFCVLVGILIGHLFEVSDPLTTTPTNLIARTFNAWVDRASATVSSWRRSSS